MGMIVAVAGTGIATSATAQVSTQGLSPGVNTARSYVDASIARDSGLNQPLDLLNDFYPSVEVTVVDHDNVRRRPDFQEDDLKITVSPGLAYLTNLGRHKFYAAYSGVFTFHDDLEQEDATANLFNAQLGLDLSHAWDLNLFAAIGSAFEERGVSGSRGFNQLINGPDGGPDEVDFESYGADLIYGRKSSRLTAVLGFEKHESEYTNNFQGSNNISGNRDREQESLHLDLNYQIGAKTSIFGRIQDSEIDYGRSLNSLDSEQTDYLVGVRWKPSNALSGVAGIGNTDRNYLDPAREDYDNTTYYLNLDYTITPFSILQFSASRVIEEPGDDQSDYFESSLLGVGWNHLINDRVSFNAYAKWITDDFNTEREDDFFDFGLGLDYAWRHWLTAGIFYGEIERDSNVEGIDYEDQFIGIRLRSDLRGLLRSSESGEEPDRSFRYPRVSN